MSQRRNNKPWSRYGLKRSTGAKGKPKKRILIVCEGEKTEPNYFRSFRVTSAVIKIKALGKNTKELVITAKHLQEQAIKNRERFDQVWCVFDRDSFKKRDFEDALLLAAKNKMQVAYSNEAFEIWYLLHFNYFSTAVSRKDYGKKLSKSLGKNYEKNSTTMYDDLQSLQSNAIKNAKKLLLSYNPHNPEADNPCTTVFKLVEELNKNL